jgi:hypothetical protein
MKNYFLKVKYLYALFSFLVILGLCSSSTWINPSMATSESSSELIVTIPMALPAGPVMCAINHQPSTGTKTPTNACKCDQEGDDPISGYAEVCDHVGQVYCQGQYCSTEGCCFRSSEMWPPPPPPE